LFLEDDKQLGPWIATGRKKEGYVVDHFSDGKDALMAAMGQPLVKWIPVSKDLTPVAMII